MFEFSKSWFHNPPWRKGIDAKEFEQLQQSVGEPDTFSARERIVWHLADFGLTKEQAYLYTRPVALQREEVYRKIMDFCYSSLAYVPMIYYNTMFVPTYSASFRDLDCPNLTITDILEGKVVGYREKIDGTLVRRAEVSNGNTSIVAWVGGISSPAFFPDIEAFELRGLDAFSIRPFNVVGSVFFPSSEIEFRARPLVFAPDPAWKEGAIALVRTAAGIFEKRIKRCPTAEMEVKDCQIVVEGRSYPIQVPRDGVYECAFYKNQFSPVAFRPWKLPTAKPFVQLLAPTFAMVRPVPELFVRYEGGAPRLGPRTIFLPKQLAVGICFARPRVSVPNLQWRALRVPDERVLPIAGVEVNVVKTGDLVLSGPESAFVGPKGSQERVGMVVPPSSSIITPYGSIWLYPHVPVGTGLCMDDHLLLRTSEAEWTYSHRRGELQERQVPAGAVIAAHGWFLRNPATLLEKYEPGPNYAFRPMFEDRALEYEPRSHFGDPPPPPGNMEVSSVVAVPLLQRRQMPNARNLRISDEILTRLLANRGASVTGLRAALLNEGIDIGIRPLLRQLYDSGNYYCENHRWLVRRKGGS